MYKLCNTQNFFFLYLLFFNVISMYSMQEKPESMDLNCTPHQLLSDTVAAYIPERHVDALAKSSPLRESVLVFPKIYNEQKDNDDALIFINYVIEVLNALPREQVITHNYKSKSVYDCRKLCEVLKKGCPTCPSGLEKRDKKKHKQNKVIPPVASSPEISNNKH